MKVDRRIAIVAVCVTAASLASCKKDVTAPVVARTYSVTATTQVPAVPTAPITIATNDTGSHVSATLSTAQLQAIVTAAGGPVTIKMTDVGSSDYGTLPSAIVATLKPDASVIVFTATLTSGGAISSNAVVDISIPVLLQETDEQAAAPFFTITTFSGNPVTSSLRAGASPVPPVSLLRIGNEESNKINNQLNNLKQLLFTCALSGVPAGRQIGCIGQPTITS